MLRCGVIKDRVNMELIMLTLPEALAEVLVTRAHELGKPSHSQDLLAEGGRRGCPGVLNRAIGFCICEGKGYRGLLFSRAHKQFIPVAPSFRGRFDAFEATSLCKERQGLCSQPLCRWPALGL